MWIRELSDLFSHSIIVLILFVFTDFFKISFLNTGQVDHCRYDPDHCRHQSPKRTGIRLDAPIAHRFSQVAVLGNFQLPYPMGISNRGEDLMNDFQGARRCASTGRCGSSVGSLLCWCVFSNASPMAVNWKLLQDNLDLDYMNHVLDHVWIVIFYDLECTREMGHNYRIVVWKVFHTFSHEKLPNANLPRLARKFPDWALTKVGKPKKNSTFRIGKVNGVYPDFPAKTRILWKKTWKLREALFVAKQLVEILNFILSFRSHPVWFEWSWCKAFMNTSQPFLAILTDFGRKMP